MLPLRDHQKKAIGMLFDRMRAGEKRLVLQLPTGAGKTRIAAEIMKKAYLNRRRAIFTVPIIDLVDQTVSAFEREGVSDIGVIQQAHMMTDRSRPIQIASLDSLARRDMPPADIVLIDEVHKTRKWVWDWMKTWPSVPFIGLSATPWTAGLGDHFKELIIPVTMQELIDAGFLSPFRAFAPSAPDLSGVKSVAGDYHEGQLSEVMSGAKIVGDVVQNYLDRGENRPTICFCVDRAHAKHLEQRFAACGVPTGYVDCHTLRGDRDALYARFKSGEVKVITNVDVLTTGVDFDVRCIILARPTRSPMRHVQAVGRALRTAPGKDHALIFDHTGTTERLGFVTDITFDALDTGNEARKKDAPSEVLPKPCPQCSYLKAPKVTRCPSCGFKPEHMPKGIACDDGELVELTASKIVSDRAEKQRWWSMLLDIADYRGKSEKWALAQYREKMGGWPRGLSDKRVPASADVRNWVKSRQIAWAKAQERAA